MRNIFIKLFLLILFDMAASVPITENVELSRSHVLIIKSPGYPEVNYKNDTVLKWNVTAPATTEEIFIEIDMYIRKPPSGKCEDYLKIQEINPSSGNFVVFDQCGNLRTNRTALGNQLLIKFISNFDVLTSKRFEVRLRVLKERSTTSTLTTRTISSSILSMKTKASIESTKSNSRPSTISKTTSTESSTKLLASSTMITKIKPKSQIHVSMTKQNSASEIPKASSTTNIINSAAPITTPTAKGISSSSSSAAAAAASLTTLSKTTEMKTTTKQIVSRIFPTSKILIKILTKTTHLKTKTTTIASTTDTACRKTKTSKLSAVTIPNSSPQSSKNTYRYVVSISTMGIPVSKRKRPSHGLTTTLSATNKISISQSFFSEQIKTKTRPYQPTQGTPKYSTYSTLSITTETKLKDITSPFLSLFTSIDKTTAILLVGLGVLEVTLIVIGALAIRRHRRRGKWKTGERTDHQERTRNTYQETSVYDEIAIDEIGKIEYEGPYKELPEGVYDTTFKRRSHLNVAEDGESNYTTGNIFCNVFRRSSICRRSVQEAPVITFSTFKGPMKQ